MKLFEAKTHRQGEIAPNTAYLNTGKWIDHRGTGLYLGLRIPLFYQADEYCPQFDTVRTGPAHLWIGCRVGWSLMSFRMKVEVIDGQWIRQKLA